MIFLSVVFCSHWFALAVVALLVLACLPVLSKILQICLTPKFFAFIIGYDVVVLFFVIASFFSNTSEVNSSQPWTKLIRVRQRGPLSLQMRWTA